MTEPGRRTSGVPTAGARPGAAARRRVAAARPADAAGPPGPRADPVPARADRSRSSPARPPGGEPWQLLGVAIPMALGLLRYLTTSFRITGGRIELQRGLLNRHVLSTPLDRVRTVDLTSSLDPPAARAHHGPDRHRHRVDERRGPPRPRRAPARPGPRAARRAAADLAPPTTRWPSRSAPERDGAPASTRPGCGSRRSPAAGSSSPPPRSAPRASCSRPSASSSELDLETRSSGPACRSLVLVPLLVARLLLVAVSLLVDRRVPRHQLGLPRSPTPAGAGDLAPDAAACSPPARPRSTTTGVAGVDLAEPLGPAPGRRRPAVGDRHRPRPAASRAARRSSRRRRAPWSSGSPARCSARRRRSTPRSSATARAPHAAAGPAPLVPALVVAAAAASSRSLAGAPAVAAGWPASPSPVAALLAVDRARSLGHALVDGHLVARSGSRRTPPPGARGRPRHRLEPPRHLVPAPRRPDHAGRHHRRRPPGRHRARRPRGRGGRAAALPSVAVPR